MFEHVNMTNSKVYQTIHVFFLLSQLDHVEQRAQFLLEYQIFVYVDHCHRHYPSELTE
jgi:hypothetical protein